MKHESDSETFRYNDNLRTEFKKFGAAGLDISTKGRLGF